MTHDEACHVASAIKGCQDPDVIEGILNALNEKLTDFMFEYEIGSIDEERHLCVTDLRNRQVREVL
jgi:hypothetical protein